uniref:non-specific serine/threonine protein kinase n=1 Tax=Ananas comosus var. bracteatus TaxID=296719 RepID=A0A6V7QLZ7_ANACO|nr:unnamed protein product [Ananas comosus var. bracteatus]
MSVPHGIPFWPPIRHGRVYVAMAISGVPSCRERPSQVCTNEHNGMQANSEDKFTSALEDITDDDAEEGDSEKEFWQKLERKKKEEQGSIAYAQRVTNYRLDSVNEELFNIRVEQKEIAKMVIGLEARIEQVLRLMAPAPRRVRPPPRNNRLQEVMERIERMMTPDTSQEQATENVSSQNLRIIGDQDLSIRKEKQQLSRKSKNNQILNPSWHQSTDDQKKDSIMEKKKKPLSIKIDDEKVAERSWHQDVQVYEEKGKAPLIEDRAHVRADRMIAKASDLVEDTLAILKTPEKCHRLIPARQAFPQTSRRLNSPLLWQSHKAHSFASLREPVDRFCACTTRNLRSLLWLALHRNYLTGSIPSSLGNLTRLHLLYAYQNNISGSIPREIGMLKNLAELTLSDNEVTGPLPSSIGNLSALTTLILYNNQISDPIPSEIGNNGNLTYVDLSNNRLTGSIPTTLANLTKLHALFLLENELSGAIPHELGRIDSLVGLILYRNKLTGRIPTSLGNLTKLTILYLYGNRNLQFHAGRVGINFKSQGPRGL